MNIQFLVNVECRATYSDFEPLRVQPGVTIHNVQQHVQQRLGASKRFSHLTLGQWTKELGQKPQRIAPGSQPGTVYITASFTTTLRQAWRDKFYAV